MIYLKTTDGTLKVIVLEAGNLAKIQQGQPAKTPDGTVIIAFTPDPVWLADKLMDCDGEAVAIAALIDESAKRQQKPVNRPPHGQHIHTFGSTHGKR